MIDVTKILKRAWNILWTYRALWMFGLILALTVAGTLPNINSGWREDMSNRQPGEVLPLPTRQELQDAWEQMQREADWMPWRVNLSTQDWNTLLWVGIGILVGLLVLGVASTIARYVAETATIRMVDEYERTDKKVGLRQGLRYGWSRTAWRLFLIELLVVSLPVALLVLGGLAIGVVIFFLILGDVSLIGTAGIVAMIGLAFLLIFLGVILGVVLTLLRDIFWRASALEGVGVRDAIRLGWELVRREWKSVGLMWLVMVAVRIGWSIAMVVAFVLSLPLMIVTILAGLIVAGVPGLLAGLVSSLFLGGPLPWIVGVLFGLPLFLVVAFSPLLFFRGLGLVYNSTVWTLTYRELNTLPKPSGIDFLDKEEPGEAIPSPF
jgi:hypothetical protein